MEGGAEGGGRISHGWGSVISLSRRLGGLLPKIKMREKNKIMTTVHSKV